MIRRSARPIAQAASPNARAAVHGLRIMGLLGMVGFAACGVAVQPGVPVEQEPRHRLVSDLEFAQVLDIQILGNDTTMFHTHSRPIAYVCLRESEVAAQPAGEEWGKAGSVCRAGTASSTPEYAESPLTHRVTNTGLDIFRLLAVQNLRDGGAPAALGPPAGATMVDNDWFRAQAIEIDPGGTEDPYTRAFPPHRHDVPTLLVLVGNGPVSSVGSDDREHVVVEPGAWAWIDAGATHSLVSVEGTPTRVVEVEVR
ncbi:MAG: cupin domain-containing protein [Gemmatimonadota bacterium]